MIQTHFAAANNVGAVAAKEEVWEVVGQLTGYACSLALLQALQYTGEIEYTMMVLRVSAANTCGPTLSPALYTLQAVAHPKTTS